MRHYSYPRPSRHIMEFLGLRLNSLFPQYKIDYYRINRILMLQLQTACKAAPFSKFHTSHFKTTTEYTDYSLSKETCKQISDLLNGYWKDLMNDLYPDLTPDQLEDLRKDLAKDQG